MNCPNCGSKISPKEKFCTKCGKEINFEEINKTAATEEPQKGRKIFGLGDYNDPSTKAEQDVVFMMAYMTAALFLNYAAVIIVIFGGIYILIARLRGNKSAWLELAGGIGCLALLNAFIEFFIHMGHF